MPLSTLVIGREDVTGPPWPVPEERRTVTVLFADIVGSTALTERLDPEDVRALQHAYFDTVAGVLRRWQGVVEKYVGDAVMALFGARRSDGLDAYRAVRAGLEIQAALDRRPMPGGVALRVRVGVATGEAVVDLTAARNGGHGSASGAVISTAARLQEYAPAGGVVVCAATHRATAGLIDQHALAPAALAGKALPVELWRVTGPARPRADRHHGPLVGRRRELATAQDQIVRVVREHRPRWVSVVGPDGIGRSRLLHELRQAVRKVDGAPVRWCVAYCPPYPEAVLAPVADLVRDLAGVRPADPPAVVRRRLAALVDGLDTPGPAATTVDALAALLGAPDRPGTGGAAAGRQVLLALAARQPVVVAVDDLDRARPQLSRFLHTLFATATLRGLPLAVVATHRPHHADPVPGPADRRCQVALAPLGAVDAGRLLRRLLGRAGRPAALAARLLPFVGGVPGRAAAYAAAGAGAASPPLPEAVRRAAEARLDRLDGAGRAVLMVAATLGAGCTAPAVARLLGWAPTRATALLRTLTREGLLRPIAHGGYAVVDPALRRVAHERLPRAIRAEFTRRAAQWPAARGGAATGEPPGRTVPGPTAREAAPGRGGFGRPARPRLLASSGAGPMPAGLVGAVWTRPAVGAVGSTVHRGADIRPVVVAGPGAGRSPARTGARAGRASDHRRAEDLTAPEPTGHAAAFARNGLVVRPATAGRIGALTNPATAGWAGPGADPATAGRPGLVEEPAAAARIGLARNPVVPIPGGGGVDPTGDPGRGGPAAGRRSPDRAGASPYGATVPAVPAIPGTSRLTIVPPGRTVPPPGGHLPIGGVARSGGPAGDGRTGRGRIALTSADRARRGDRPARRRPAGSGRVAPVPRAA